MAWPTLQTITVVLGQSVWVTVRGPPPKICVRWGPAPCNIGRACPLTHIPLPMWDTMLYLIAVGQTIGAEKLGISRPAFQGWSRSSEL